MSRPAVVPLTRSEWGLILVLVAVQFTHMVDFVIIMPLGERLMHELAISERQFGWIVAAYAWAAGLASLLASAVMDRFDRRLVLLSMYAGFVVSTAFCGLAWDYPSMLVGRTLAGVFGGLAAVALMAVVGDVFEPAKRGRALGAITSSFAVASVIGLPVGLELAARYGRGAPFLVLAVLSLGVWVLGFVKLPSLRAHLRSGPVNRLGEFAAIAREPAHLWAFAFSFFLVLGTFTVASFFGPVLMSRNGWTEQQLKWVYVAAGLCTLVGMNVIGRLADRLPRRQLFQALGFACLVVTLVVTNLPAGSLWVACLAVSGFMVFAAGRMVPAQALILGVARPEQRGGFMSLNTSVQHLATGLAPTIASEVLYRDAEGGPLLGFATVGLIAAGAAAVSLLLAYRLRPAASPAAVRQPSPAGVPEPEPLPA